VEAENDLDIVDARIDELLARFADPRLADVTEFRRAQFDLGLAWVHFRVGDGGLGVSASHQGSIEARLRAAGAPPRNGAYVAMHQGAASIHAVGTPEQRARFLRPMFTGEDAWCQLFSEPGAGSDLAGLATMAVRDGDEWVVNGQKVWTSGAMDADWAILVARTDPDQPKHRGLTFFICDMSVPGIDIRPLRHADGAAHFAEAFLSDVRLPDELRLGDVGYGWGVSVAGLHSERAGVGDAFHVPIERLLELWRARPEHESGAALALRDEVTRAWIGDQVLRLNQERLRAASGETPLGSTVKVAAAEFNQRLSSLMTTLLGPAGLVGLDYEAQLREDPDRLDWHEAPQQFVLRSIAMSIEGGTSEINRNIIGERVLGLPGDIRVDKDRPWREVPRS